MTDNPHLTPQRQPEDADAALRPRTLAEFVGQAAAILVVLGLTGTAAAREVQNEVLFPPEVISGAEFDGYDAGIFGLFRSEPLWPTSALEEFSERYRFTYFGILRFRLQIRIDGRADGSALLHATVVRDRRVIERTSRRLSASDFVAFKAVAQSSGLWTTFPEFWVPVDPDAICIDGMEAIIERRTIDGYGYSRGNTSCTSPSGMNLLAERMVELAHLESSVRWFPWDRNDR